MSDQSQYAKFGDDRFSGEFSSLEHRQVPLKKFDWEECRRMHSPAMLAFLRQAKDGNYSEDRFVREYRLVPRITPRSRRSPSTARSVYRNLCDSFGWFNDKP